MIPMDQMAIASIQLLSDLLVPPAFLDMEVVLVVVRRYILFHVMLHPTCCSNCPHLSRYHVLTVIYRDETIFTVSLHSSTQTDADMSLPSSTSWRNEAKWEASPRFAILPWVKEISGIVAFLQLQHHLLRLMKHLCFENLGRISQFRGTKNFISMAETELILWIEVVRSSTKRFGPYKRPTDWRQRTVCLFSAEQLRKPEKKNSILAWTGHAA